MDFQTGFVLDATVSDWSGEVVEELHLTDVVWSDEPADVSGAVGVDSDWTVTQGLPAEPVVGDRYLVPESLEPVRTFTTDAAVASGSEAGNPPSDDAYVVDVSTGLWRHSKVIVLGRTDGEWQDPLASEGWFYESEVVTPDSGVLAGIDGSLVAAPPIRPRAWFETADEIVAVQGLIDPATAETLWNLEQAAVESGPGFSADLPYVSGAPAGEESAFSLEGGVVLARQVEDGAAAVSAWVRAIDEIWWEPAGGVLGVEPLLLDTGDAHAVVLLDAFVDDDGEIAVIYGEVRAPGALDGAETNVWLQRFRQPRSEAVALGWFAGIEHGVDAASRGGDRIAVSAGADLGEVFTFYDLQGNEIDEPNNPVAVGHRYNEPPWYQHVSLAPDGRTLAFVEGPDWDQDAQAIVGDWELVVVDLDSGDETARLALGDRGTMRVSFVDFDGTWAVISRTEDTGDLRQDQPLPALAVDTTGGTVTELAGRTGIVTLVNAR